MPHQSEGISLRNKVNPIADLSSDLGDRIEINSIITVLRSFSDWDYPHPIIRFRNDFDFEPVQTGSFLIKLDHRIATFSSNKIHWSIFIEDTEIKKF